MNSGRTASQLGTLSSGRTSTDVTATRETELSTAETGAPVWADTQAKQVAPGLSACACTCTACAQTANRTSVTQTAQAQRFQRNSNFAELSIIDGGTKSMYPELYNELRIYRP
jgi:hypothetical protein